ncbi:PQQ-dependent sugar dehydrogenase [Frigidibacter sp. ROC022]|uniref:PQQ-dependent sugar dehydrogenase n=1 Tax=Frigidibacter sp. ROC022 TaxID=2971796 RepID=UPI00215B4790|nr:PQQ-dependent sugar dehydrogenase [Frigidibacter sp. ROC022]MCR8723609.1 PQQ-dependent sugar dehydrogenase [Frigidibacter sp. ROC022]
MFRHRLIWPCLALALALPAGAGPIAQGPANVPEFSPAFPEQTRAPELPQHIALTVTPVATGLSHPWGLAILPSGGYLVTERAGRLRHVAPDGSVSAPIAGLPEVLAFQQGGLLDVALAPDFATSRVIFWTYAKPLPGNKTATAAARGVLSADMTRLTEVRDIFVQTPPSGVPAHFGSRITPQGELVWITTGEHFTLSERQKAQSLATTYGKVIRLHGDGSVPEDNPFVGDAAARPEIWSYGHRNIQGDALDPEGRYWTVEHGPQGGDELNLPLAGRNHGWPVISYGENYNGTPVGSGRSAAPGMEQPVYYWDPVIAPGDMVFYRGAAFPDWNGSLIIASLTPGGLNRLVLKRDRVIGEQKLLPDLGRVRDVDVDTDGSLLVLTDAEDGALLRIAPG